MRILIGIAFGDGVLADSSASLGMTVGIGFGIGFVSYFSLVFGLVAVAFGFVFGAEDLHVPSVAGGVVFYSSFLYLLDLADCFE